MMVTNPKIKSLRALFLVLYLLAFVLLVGYSLFILPQQIHNSYITSDTVFFSPIINTSNLLMTFLFSILAPLFIVSITATIQDQILFPKIFSYSIDTAEEKKKIKQNNLAIVILAALLIPTTTSFYLSNTTYIRITGETITYHPDFIPEEEKYTWDEVKSVKLYGEIFASKDGRGKATNYFRPHLMFKIKNDKQIDAMKSWGGKWSEQAREDTQKLIELIKTKKIPYTVTKLKQNETEILNRCYKAGDDCKANKLLLTLFSKH